ncbi:unnamed protein product, partial [Discosporangium mesarthrocarpum]
LENPVAKVTAKPSAARRARSGLAGGLERTIYLPKRAKTMLTRNLWQQVGLVNGISEVVKPLLCVLQSHSPP